MRSSRTLLVLLVVQMPCHLPGTAGNKTWTSDQEWPTIPPPLPIPFTTPCPNCPTDETTATSPPTTTTTTTTLPPTITTATPPPTTRTTTPPPTTTTTTTPPPTTTTSSAAEEAYYIRNQLHHRNQNRWLFVDCDRPDYVYIWHQGSIWFLRQEPRTNYFAIVPYCNPDAALTVVPPRRMSCHHHHRQPWPVVLRDQIEGPMRSYQLWRWVRGDKLESKQYPGYVIDTGWMDARYATAVIVGAYYGDQGWGAITQAWKTIPASDESLLHAVH